MRFVLRILAAVVLPMFLGLSAIAQTPSPTPRGNVRTVSIPISIFTKQELKEDRLQEYLELDRLIVKENGDEQQILSIRTVDEAPLALAVLIQDDLTSEFNLQISEIKKFITSLPRGSRVMVAYLRGGTAQIRQKFTTDLEAAANSLRIVTSSSITAPRNPFDGVVDMLDRFDALPAGRRAILMVSDGVDLSAGVSNASPGQSIDLDRAILRAQRRSVAIFSVYSPTSSNPNDNSTLTLYGQGSLQKLSDETGGRAFFQGSAAPVSYIPFFRDLSLLLRRQFLLTYLSTHLKKGYYKVQVTSTNPVVKIEHPRGYYYR
jgi:VWFA-related protein